MKRILIIAASDSGGGAGIQADVKAVTLCGGFAMTAVTALTAQNTQTVQDVYPIPVPFIEKQIDVVLQDIGADAIKTGMLFDAEIIHSVAKKIMHYRIDAVVVDPVMKSKGGDTLLQDAAIETMIRELFPRALVVTPNLDEASLLCGHPVDSLATMKTAAQRIKQMGSHSVVITGGHLAGDCIDLFYDGTAYTEFSSPRISTRNTHGTGCTFASALATEIAKGSSLAEAVKSAKDFIHTAISHSLSLGKGHGPTNPFAAVRRAAGLWECAAALKEALSTLQQSRIGHLIPEVQSNLGFALEDAAMPNDVVAFPGRLIRLTDSIVSVEDPAPGASQHIAKIILTVLKYDRRFRSAMNLRYSPAVIEQCRACGFSMASFDRGQEPPAVKQAEGSTLEWGTDLVLSTASHIPDIIFDTGDVGKEAMIRLLGTSPHDVAEKAIRIAYKGNR
jgi:hydroxymethylpyrimidine/phosphomethylpyrimidine kinase